ncbi:5-methylthioribose kinase [Fontibacillus solani]|uniref:5-methylthioribose kinase n=1 Tax=Fontibacillus solani TaxID=1572857 RepID=A0A7W3XR40_9BACL|nr:hypothetical protein [Fontibacillus solani]MBA9085070.1 5-methylthioribose kinase [Fontibacillus solani]
MTQSQYNALSIGNAIAYAKTVPDFFAADAILSCEEIGDGNLNLVFRIKDSLMRKKSDH